MTRPGTAHHNRFDFTIARCSICSHLDKLFRDGLCSECHKRRLQTECKKRRQNEFIRP